MNTKFLSDSSREFIICINEREHNQHVGPTPDKPTNARGGKGLGKESAQDLTGEDETKRHSLAEHMHGIGQVGFLLS